MFDFVGCVAGLMPQAIFTLGFNGKHGVYVWEGNTLDCGYIIEFFT
jgi:hypothetical protein